MVYGGVIPDTNEGKARIRFVTEGEASLHACVLAADVLSVRTHPRVCHRGLSNAFAQSTSNHGFLIADAGGGTLDLSSYTIRGTHPLVIEEIAPPDCAFSDALCSCKHSPHPFPRPVRRIRVRQQACPRVPRRYVRHSQPHTH